MWHINSSWRVRAPKEETYIVSDECARARHRAHLTWKLKLVSGGPHPGPLLSASVDRYAFFCPREREEVSIPRLFQELCKATRPDQSWNSNEIPSVLTPTNLISFLAKSPRKYRLPIVLLDSFFLTRYYYYDRKINCKIIELYIWWFFSNFYVVKNVAFYRVQNCINFFLYSLCIQCV